LIHGEHLKQTRTLKLYIMAKQQKTKRQLTEEELKSVKQIKEKYTQIKTELGEIEILKQNLKTRKVNAIEALSITRQTEQQLTVQLTEKYGNGNIDLTTGLIS
jgi:hypothetical protein